MTSETVGREPVQVVEIKQPFCDLTFGVSPCTATGTADQKCYNTFRTCKDTDNFTRGTLSLFFSTGNVADRGISDVSHIFPFLVSVSTMPTTINLAGSDPDQAGLATRAVLTVVMSDSQHTDNVVDPYVDERSWNPLDKERGTFWQRWMPRNKYRKNIEIVVYEGYAGQDLADMVIRTFFVESVQGPSNNRVTFKAKDILARAEDRKAQAPLLSTGVLQESITDSATTLVVSGADLADYPATGIVRVNDEIMTYASRATTGDNITFSGVTRAQFNTVAEAHEFDTLVQLCLRYDNVRADDVVKDLLTIYAGIDEVWLDTANWASEFDDFSAFYFLDTLITEPKGVANLVSEIMTQVGVFIWWDERSSIVKWKAIRGVDEPPPLLTDDINILKDTFSLSEYPRRRVSRVWLYYDRVDFIKADDDPSAYKEAFEVVNLEAESGNQYGEKQVRKIFSRWLPTSALAENTGGKILTRYVDPPAECVFEMDAKDRTYWVGDTVRISHFMDRDEFGERRIRNWTIIKAEELKAGERARYTAQDTTLYGQINYIMAGGAADYNPAGGNPVKSCFIGDADGLLSDGTQCGRIA